MCNNNVYRSRDGSLFTCTVFLHIIISFYIFLCWVLHSTPLQLQLLQHQPNVNSFSRHRLDVYKRYKNAGNAMLCQQHLYYRNERKTQHKISSRNFCYRIYYVHVYIISEEKHNNSSKEGNNIYIYLIWQCKIFPYIEVLFQEGKGNGFMHDNIFIFNGSII